MNLKKLFMAGEDEVAHICLSITITPGRGNNGLAGRLIIMKYDVYSLKDEMNNIVM